MVQKLENILSIKVVYLFVRIKLLCKKRRGSLTVSFTDRKIQYFCLSVLAIFLVHCMAPFTQSELFLLNLELTRALDAFPKTRVTTVRKNW